MGRAPDYRSSVTTPAPEIGFYGEFDPYGGGVSCRSEDLPRLVRELKLFLLVKDIVIFSPGCMLEHRLALPACEALAPFVRCGRLTTTASPNLSTPSALLDERAGKYLEVLGSRSRQRFNPHPQTTERRRTEALSIINRWRSILPPAWSITRDVNIQIEQFATGLLEFTTHHPQPSPSMSALRHSVEGSLATGRPLDRMETLKHVAALRTSTRRSELAQMVFVTQALFFKFGVDAHQQCTLYPGPFARLAYRRQPHMGVLYLPPVDWSAEPEQIEKKLTELGVDLDVLLSLPAAVLLEIVNSTEWRIVRNALRGFPMPRELTQELSHLFKSAHDFPDALALVPEKTGSAFPRLCGPWQLATNAALGIVGTPNEASSFPALDLSTHSLVAPGSEPHPITAAHVEILTALVASGEVGIAVDDLEQFVLDIDRISPGVVSLPPPWRTKAADSYDLGRARAGRLRTLINRVNKELGLLGLRIMAEDGRYVIKDIAEGNRQLRLHKTLLSLVEELESIPTPSGLSPMQARLWRALADRAPQPMTVRQVAASLGKPDSERGKKQAVEALVRLGTKLDVLGIPWRVEKLRRGAYALLPRA